LIRKLCQLNHIRVEVIFRVVDLICIFLVIVDVLEWLAETDSGQTFIENSFLNAVPNSTLLASLLYQTLVLFVEVQYCYYHVQQNVRLGLVLAFGKANES
jgi:hypothetical protein